jgi:hypothetical protein
MSVVDLSMVDLALGARHAVSLGNLGIAVAIINHDSSLVARLFVAAARERARHHDHEDAAPAAPRADLAPSGFTNSEPFPGLWLGARSQCCVPFAGSPTSNPRRDAP